MPRNTGNEQGEPGLSKRERTRRRIVNAARELFLREGFYESRLGDVAPLADVATGTFYLYFKSKEEVFKAVMEEVLHELKTDPDAEASPSRHSPMASIRNANRAYLRGYRRNARLMADCTALARDNEEIRHVKDAIDAVFEQRLVSRIVHWQQTGVARTDIDARYAANALAFMVDRFANEFYVFGKPYDEDVAVETLTKLWAGALGIGDV